VEYQNRRNAHQLRCDSKDEVDTADPVLQDLILSRGERLIVAGSEGGGKEKT
jgi:hypothetical protein